ncbi:hypothetical protein BDN71DRAFT_1398402 [Pleurotus eryngii]|uniref:Uncharacterized protein n=1 Tax=Pleurotus eryngii TaxID=5323 RepID=A0A9P5ZPZ4_PLEER|nr:hypothetical protein BDN71DRAFT_1398402 [Pleurotus eryngii]
MLRSYDIHESIMEQLSLNNLHWYSLTCKAIYDEVQGHYKHNYSLNPILKLFIPSEYIPAFHRLQKKYRPVISGSVALQFLTRVTYPESDLNLYVKYACAFEVGKWLELEVGCTVLDFHGEACPFYHTFLRCNYSFKGMHAVFSFLSPINLRKVQLIICWCNVIEVILSFHSTIIMNVITVSYAYSFHGEETLERKISLAVDRARSAPMNLEAAQRKYSNCGWMMVSTQAVALQLKAFEGWTARRVGDSKCWIVRLPAVEGADVFLTTDPLSKNEWVLVYKFDVPNMTLGL